jgi:Interferon-induced transmembrane protein
MTESEPTTPTQTPPGQPPVGPPPHNVGWAVAAVLFFWPLAFSAFTHAFNVYPLWAAGNYAGAQYASDRFRRLGQLSLWIAGGLLLIFVILYTIFVIVMISQAGGWDGGWGHRRRMMD